VVTNRYIIVLVDKFNRFRYAGRATTTGYPVKKNLPVRKTPQWCNPLEIVSQELSESAGIFIGKYFSGCFGKFRTERH
jgi:hypothetical protein